MCDGWTVDSRLPMCQLWPTVLYNVMGGSAARAGFTTTHSLRCLRRGKSVSH